MTLGDITETTGQGSLAFATACATLALLWGPCSETIAVRTVR